MVDTSDYMEVNDDANGSTCNQRASLWNWSTVAEPPVAQLPSDRLSRPAAARARRIVLYSHDTMGLGHTRRNLLLAHTIAAANPLTDILLIVGEREGTLAAQSSSEHSVWMRGPLPPRHPRAESAIGAGKARDRTRP